MFTDLPIYLSHSKCMSTVHYKRNTNYTHKIYCSYHTRGEWREYCYLSYRRDVTEAILEAHNPNILAIASYESFHVVRIESLHDGRLIQ